MARARWSGSDRDRSDRLAEEKRRGITIDLGFANLELPSPNGEPFASALWMFPDTSALCATCWPVSAASIWFCWLSRPTSPSSPRPASTSTSASCCMCRGFVAITKSDLVNREMLEVVRLEVEEFLRGSFLDSPLDSLQPADLVTSPARSKAEIVAVSSLTGAGLEELKMLYRRPRWVRRREIPPRWRACRLTGYSP